MCRCFKVIGTKPQTGLFTFQKSIQEPSELKLHKKRLKNLLNENCWYFTCNFAMGLVVFPQVLNLEEAHKRSRFDGNIGGSLPIMPTEKLDSVVSQTKSIFCTSEHSFRKLHACTSTMCVSPRFTC